jgi:hypothetical protein
MHAGREAQPYELAAEKNPWSISGSGARCGAGGVLGLIDSGVGAGDSLVFSRIN